MRIEILHDHNVRYFQKHHYKVQNGQRRKKKRGKPRGEALAATASNSRFAIAQSTAIGLLLTNVPLTALIACKFS